MDLDALIAGLPIVRTGMPGLGAVRICDITEDSRTVMPGSLFIARRGERTDGRAFIGKAIESGAVAVLIESDRAVRATPIQLPAPRGANPAVLLVTKDLPGSIAAIAERFYGSPSSSLALIGVTGTNGKTTTTYLIHQLLNSAPRPQGGQRCGLIGTVCVDDGTEIAPASLTTPPALELSRTLARMAEGSCTAAAMEVSSHALDQHRVGALRFRVGVFTNLTHDHLDYHKTLQAYADAKARLFAMLPDDDEGGVAIVNSADPWSTHMLRRCRAKVVRCAEGTRDGPGGAHADWLIRAIKRDARCTRVRIAGPWGKKPWTIDLPLVGDFNLTNAVQAAAAAHAVGLSPEAIREGLGRVKAPPGRLEPITPVGAPVAVYVDYAHTDDALQRALMVFREAMPGFKPKKAPARLICVFGCGGDRDATKRPKMGSVAARLADLVYVTSDNPRTEDPRMIIEQIVGGVPANRRGVVVVEPDRSAAIHQAIGAARPGDVVLIAGKGHEDYQIMPDGRGGTVKHHFDDREVGRAALAAAARAAQRAEAPQPARARPRSRRGPASKGAGA